MSRTHLHQSFLSETKSLAGYLPTKLWKDSNSYGDEVLLEESRQNFVAAERDWRR